MQPQQQNQSICTDRLDAGVRLHAKARKAGTKVEWSLDFKNPPAKGSKAEVKLEKASGGHDIVIRLIPTQGLDIRFKTSDPIWVSEKSQCPPPPGVCTDQITIVDCDDNELRIHDCNNGLPRNLTYQLNFVGADGLDPMIRNGGK
jgi:hypothetical protein